MYRLKCRFKSMKFHIQHELKEEIANNDFDIGYYEGKHSTLLEDEDLHYMYSIIKSGDEVHLWCDLDLGEEPPSTPPPPKKKEERSSKREDKEKKVEETIQALQEKHEDKYTAHQYTLWARMIANNLHQSYDDPPNVPQICGIVSKPPKQKDNISDVISMAATALVKAVRPT